MRPLSMWMSICGEWGEVAPPPHSIPAGATPTHRPHAVAGSPGCAPRSPGRHRRCTAPVRFPAAPGRCPPARRTHSPPPIVCRHCSESRGPAGCGGRPSHRGSWARCGPPPGVAAAVGEHLLAALLSESVKALAAQLQQLVALGVAQLLAAHQVVGAPLVAGDADTSEHLAHHPLDAFG